MIQLYVYMHSFLCSLKNRFIYFLVVVGLHCCMWAFSSSGKRGLLFPVVCRLLTVGASLVAEHGL